MRGGHRVCMWASVVLLSLSLTGCWDQEPIEYRAAVDAIAVDPTRTSGVYAYTFLFPNITVTATTIASTPPSQQFYPIQVDAPTLIKAINAVEARQSRLVYLGQIRILCLSSRLPADVWSRTLQEAADAGRFILTFYVVGAPNARRAISVTPPSDVVPNVALHRALNGRTLPNRWPGRAWREWVRAVTPGASTAVVEVDPSATHWVIQRLAVVGRRVVLWTPEASTGWAYLTGRVRRQSTTVTAGGQVCTVGAIRGTTHVHVVRAANGIWVRVGLHYTGVVIGSAVGGRDTAAVRRQTEHAVANQIHTAVEAAWTTAHQTGTDPMGFHRLGGWSDQTIPEDAADWSDWHLRVTVHFVLRAEGILR